MRNTCSICDTVLMAAIEQRVGDERNFIKAIYHRLMPSYPGFQERILEVYCPKCGILYSQHALESN